MLGYFQLDSWEQVSVKFEIIFIQENEFENVVCQPFCSGGDELKLNVFLVILLVMNDFKQQFFEADKIW